jgi:hypothetical protein
MQQGSSKKKRSSKRSSSRRRSQSVDAQATPDRLRDALKDVIDAKARNSSSIKKAGKNDKLKNTGSTRAA